MAKEKTKILILGGGFGGVYTAMYLEKLLKKRDDFEIAIVNRENYFVYQPMLPEVVGGSLGILDTVSPIRKLLPKTHLYIREIDSIDIEKKTVTLLPQFTHKPTTLEYDHLVIGLGNVTDFRGIQGLHEHALPFKNLADTLIIRNRVIDAIETAAFTEDPDLRKQLLTFVIGGGGFSGTEVTAEINDLVHRLIKQYPRINKDEVRVVLVHAKERLLDRELSPNLGTYAGKLLQKRGVEILFGQRLNSATPQEAVLANGERIPSKTIISTVPSSPNPVIEHLPFINDRGKIPTNRHLLADEKHGIWAIGDCALIPSDDEGSFSPPTAQFAIRQAKILAHNIAATVRGEQKKQFSFQAIGMLGALGHHSAVAEIFKKFKFSGILAWLLWRAIYWIKLPGASRKMKVMLTWLLDMIIPIEPVQLKITPSQAIASLHFEAGEVIFYEGDYGDYLYIITSGEVEVLQTRDGKENVIANLGKGEFFGEMALLNQRSRTATIRCKAPTDVLALRKQDFGVLITNFGELRESFEKTEKKRSEELK